MISFACRNLQRSAQVRREGSLFVRWADSFGHGLATATSPEIETNKIMSVEVHPFKAHRIEPPSTQVETSRDELLEMFKLMNIMRRSEVRLLAPQLMLILFKSS